MKKKICLSVMLGILCCALSMAQEAKRLSVGLGVEGNMNTHEYAAFGGSVVVEYGITDAWAAGIRFTTSYNFTDMLVFDPMAFGRLYVFKLPVLSAVLGSGTLLGGLYAEAGVGAAVVLQTEYEAATTVLGEVAVGWRFTFGDWYVEPSVRGGVPFLWGVSVGGGYRINLKKK
ncbi:hypothetical protein FACS189483_03400 [Spirochaetia bacterium]|nr:hypothetical protein FACS189483_03400 [Spirochaetia bacterium]